MGRLRGLDPYASAWLGSQLAACVLTAIGDTEGLPSPADAAALLSEAAAITLGPAPRS